MMYIFYAILFTFGLFLSSSGNMIGTNILFFLTSIHLTMMILSSGFFSSIFMSPGNTELEVEIKENKVSNSILLVAFLATSAYHLYTLGYALYAGMLASTISISTISIILKVIYATKEE